MEGGTIRSMPGRHASAWRHFMATEDDGVVEQRLQRGERQLLGRPPNRDSWRNQRAHIRPAPVNNVNAGSLSISSDGAGSGGGSSSGGEVSEDSQAATRPRIVGGRGPQDLQRNALRRDAYDGRPSPVRALACRGGGGVGGGGG